MGKMPERCSYCGARLAPSAERCEYCGTVFGPDPEPAGKPDGAGGQPAPPKPAAFPALEAHPQYRDLLAHEPEAGNRTRSHVVTLAFLGIFAGFSFWMAQSSGSLVPIIFVFIGLILFVRALSRMRRDKGTPTRAMPVFVFGKRVEERDDIPRHHATLEFKEGGRRETRVSVRQASAMAEGDMGVAYFRDDRMIEFRPVKLGG